jgi:hypothetical protein
MPDVLYELAGSAFYLHPSSDVRLPRHDVDRKRSVFEGWGAPVT